jgi:cation diffusion facilitator CzcD-associated flavoprotein CzcO
MLLQVSTVAFNDSSATWHISTERGDQLTADFVIICIGLLSTPKFPDTAGLADFKGELLHSSQWKPETSLAGKTVGVVGTGATAVQLIPEAATVSVHVLLCCCVAVLQCCGGVVGVVVMW